MFYRWFSAIVMGAFLAGCGATGSTPELSPGAPKVFARVSHAEKTLYTFQGFPNGQYPSALIEAGGTLYGATQLGGDGPCEYVGQRVAGCGTIFAIDESGGGYTVLHTFPRSGLGGAFPGSLTYVGGALYGTTAYGGGKGCATSAGCGTAFRLRTSGAAFRVLLKFDGIAGGSNVQGTAASGDAFYGAAFNGGDPKCQCGVVFKLAQNGAETVLHAFAKGTDGENPAFPPIVTGGELYGTTQYGGGPACSYSGTSECGTIYAMSTSGKHYAALYRFKGGTDGATPNNVVALNGWLYGTTTRGGGSGCGGAGCGTVYKIRVSGAGYTILHRFKGGEDGEAPGAIVAAGNALYSVTTGGSVTCGSDGKIGCGTIFTLNTSGPAYAVLYRFTGGADGARPYQAPIEANGVLYGEADNGGDLSCNPPFGCGTIYSLKP